MSENTPQAIHLADYTPPAFFLEHVDIHFELAELKTLVSNRMEVRRNPHHTGGENLFLDGHDLVLKEVRIDGDKLAPDRYRQHPDGLEVLAVSDSFLLEVVTEIKPQENTSLEGLYKSDGMFCTQCEAEGFRRITYFLDRPDVMARYTTTIVAPKARYPVLLSNGNLVATGDLEDGRHWAKWHDPFLKPSYLFALVAGDLLCQESRFVTRSGREVLLQLYVEPADIDRCDHALASLAEAMRWDEEVYGCEYDLDVYMIVAVSHFNMGAMENKGLNIFNSVCVLAKPETATDHDYENIQAIIAHEYFHNWTGNRITCRDWFQLSLKEGLTVFRDQEFSADMNSRPVKRIADVNILRTSQFPQDAGPMAHPVRPASYIDISNFYTVTVYNKGAEVVRMIHSLLGAAGFRRGSDLYFQRHDGQAVTTDDFVRCMEDANHVDLEQFRLWYSQAGTPELHITSAYQAQSRELVLEVRQTVPPTPDMQDKQAMHIPLALGLLDEHGRDLPLRLAGESQAGPATRVVELKQAQEQIRIQDVDGPVVPSLLRGFSAPVKLNFDYSDEQLMFLMAHDSDAFNRWEAGQRLATRLIHDLIEQIKGGQALGLDEGYIDAFSKVLQDERLEPAFISHAINLPNENYLAEQQAVMEPDHVYQAREFVATTLARTLKDIMWNVYDDMHEHGPYVFNNVAAGRRGLKNQCLAYLTRLGSEDVIELAQGQFQKANNMTDKIAALAALNHVVGDVRQQALDDFYQRWQDDHLVVNKWFALQSRSPLANVDEIDRLMAHRAFELTNPNDVRAVIGGFCFANPSRFHDADGEGYQFLADQIIRLNDLNPQMASRLAGGFNSWRRFDSRRQKLMQAELERVLAHEGLARDVYEIVSKTLA